MDDEHAYLTTTGRRTGRPHTVELWYRRLGDVVWFVTDEPDRCDWLANARAHPDVTVRLHDETYDGVARFDLDDTEARRALAARYQGCTEGQPMSTWASSGTALAVVLSSSAVTA